MTIDPDLRSRGEFPVDKPIEALKADHNIVRKLFEQYFQTQNGDDKKEAGHHILLLLDMHASLEEDVFYPRVRDIDASLIEQFEGEHEQAKQMVETLKMMDDTDPSAEHMFRQLADAILHHVETEEQQLFPKVEKANLDLSAIGQEMQAAQLRMIAAHAQRPVAPGLRT